MVRNQVLRYQWQVLNDEIKDAEPSHCIENFRIAAGELQGTFHGMVFQDSDLAKWLEAVAYALQTRPDPELEALADQAVALVAARSSQMDISTPILPSRNREAALQTCATVMNYTVRAI